MGIRVSDVLNKHIKVAKANTDKAYHDALNGPVSQVQTDEKWKQAIAKYSVHYAGLLMLRRLKRDLKKNKLISY